MTIKKRYPGAGATSGRGALKNNAASEIGNYMNNITKNSVWFDEYNAHGDYEKATRALKKSEPDFVIKWVASDAWRGHFEAKPKRGSGWQAVNEIEGEKLAGWVTGEWDDAPHGTRGSELEQLLEKLEASEAKIIFLPTSNVFSTAYDVFIKKNDDAEDSEPEAATYKIVRFYKDEDHPDNKKIIRRGLTLAEAQAHCQREDTHEAGEWFDGYTEE